MSESNEANVEHSIHIRCHFKEFRKTNKYKVLRIEASTCKLPVNASEEHKSPEGSIQSMALNLNEQKPIQGNMALSNSHRCRQATETCLGHHRNTHIEFKVKQMKLTI